VAGNDTFEPVYRECARAQSRTTHKQVLWQYMIGYIPPGRKSRFEEKRRKVERLRDKVAAARAAAKWELSSQVTGKPIPNNSEQSSQAIGNSVPSSNRELSSHESLLVSAHSESGPESAHNASADAAFDRWYAIYPRKVARQDAAKAFPQALKRIARQQSISAEQAIEWLCGITQSFASSPTGQAGRWCPFPATWLNGARYDDDPKEWNRDGQRNEPAFGSGQVYDADAAERDPGM
jgi:hypothetical protein